MVTCLNSSQDIGQRRRTGVKIALNLRQDESTHPDADREKAIVRDVEASKKSDWEARTRLVQMFMPLMTSLAKKRTQDTANMNRYIEAGKEGLAKAIKNYRTGTDGKFQVFALKFIDDAMDRTDHPGFFARLFGRG